MQKIRKTVATSERTVQATKSVFCRNTTADVQMKLCSSGFAFHPLNYKTLFFALLRREFPVLVTNEGRVRNIVTSSIPCSQLILSALRTCARFGENEIILFKTCA